MLIPGRTTTPDHAMFVCEGSMHQEHEALWFTEAQAGKGCPNGCACPMVNVNHGVQE